jgi:fatty acid desaturase
VHAAPPVRVTLGRSRGWVALAAVVAGAALANLITWLLLHAGWPGVTWFMPLVALGAAAAATWAWRNQVPACLEWDGTRWQWAGREGDLTVTIDLNRWMLLCFVASYESPRCWIAASRSASEGSWPAMRAALYSRRPDTPSGAPPA